MMNVRLIVIQLFISLVQLSEGRRSQWNDEFYRSDGGEIHVGQQSPQSFREEIMGERPPSSVQSVDQIPRQLQDFNREVNTRVAERLIGEIDTPVRENKYGSRSAKSYSTCCSRLNGICVLNNPVLCSLLELKMQKVTRKPSESGSKTFIGNPLERRRNQWMNLAELITGNNPVGESDREFAGLKEIGEKHIGDFGGEIDDFKEMGDNDNDERGGIAPVEHTDYIGDVRNLEEIKKISRERAEVIDELKQILETIDRENNAQTGTETPEKEKEEEKDHGIITPTKRNKLQPVRGKREWCCIGDIFCFHRCRKNLSGEKKRRRRRSAEIPEPSTEPGTSKNPAEMLTSTRSPTTMPAVCRGLHKDIGNDIHSLMINALCLHHVKENPRLQFQSSHQMDHSDASNAGSSNKDTFFKSIHSNDEYNLKHLPQSVHNFPFAITMTPTDEKPPSKGSPLMSVNQSRSSSKQLLVARGKRCCLGDIFCVHNTQFCGRQQEQRRGRMSRREQIRRSSYGPGY